MQALYSICGHGSVLEATALVPEEGVLTVLLIKLYVALPLGRWMCQQYSGLGL